MLFKTQKAFVLPSVVGVCALMIAISGGLLMQTTESRLAMRKLAQVNNFGMSMDTVMRDFGRKTAEMAVAGEGPISMIDPSTFAGVLRESFPAEWIQATQASPPMADISVGISAFPEGKLLPNLMGDPTSYSILRASADRSNLLKQGQNFAGRSWGLEVSSRVEIFDNLADLEGSWYKKLESATGNFSGRTLGQTDASGRAILMKGESKNIVTITEIPSQFSVQGQNMSITPSSGLQANKIGKASGEAPVLLGKNVQLDSGLSINSDRRLVTRGRIVDRGALPSQSSRAAVGTSNLPGVGYDQELEEAGSILLVNVGTRGPEIFRPAQDYSASIQEMGHQDQKMRSMEFSNHLTYWLPYYQCNLRVVVRMPSSSPLTNLTSSEQYSVSTVYSSYNKAPDERAMSDSLPAAFEGMRGVTETINRFGKAVLQAGGPAPPRPITVVSRHSYNATTGASQWINTVDVDIRKIQELATQAALPAVALHIDIRDQNGNFIPDVEKFPVIIRQGKEISKPLSIVTPGTMYLQGPFAQISTSGAHPFSLFAPKVRYGMVSRDPSSVTVQGQKITVGSRDPTQPSVPLEVRGGSESTEISSGNLLANAQQGVGGLKVAPVHLKDWLIETFNIWVDR